MSDIKLCIVIPTYNRKEKLQRTLKALENQSCSSFNVIVSDNNSSYNINEIISDFNRDFINRIHIYKNPYNVGMCGNFALSLLRTTCSWTWMISDDDIIRKDAVEIILKSISMHQDCAWLDFPYFGAASIIHEDLKISGIREFLEFSLECEKKVKYSYMYGTWLITDKVYNMKIMSKYMHVFYDSTYSGVPQVYLYLSAMNDGCCCAVSTDSIIDYDSTGEVSWNAKSLFLHTRIISDFNLNLSWHEKCALYRLISMDYKTVLSVYFRSNYEENDYSLSNLYHDLYRHILYPKEKILFVILMKLGKMKWGYNLVRKVRHMK